MIMDAIICGLLLRFVGNEVIIILAGWFFITGIRTCSKINTFIDDCYINEENDKIKNTEGK